MTLASLISSLLDRTSALLQPVTPLLTRLVIGQSFVLTGLGKWRNFESTVVFFTSLGIPAPTANAAFVATLELVGGACLVLGLSTRVVALLLSATMVAALLTADGPAFLAALAPGGDKGLTDVVPLVFLLFLLGLAAYGAGPLSLDRWIARRQPTPETPDLAVAGAL